MVFGWVYKRVLKGAAKKLETDPELQKELSEAVKRALETQFGGGNRPNQADSGPQEVDPGPLQPATSTSQGEVSSYEEVLDSDPDEVVLEGYYQAFTDARKRGDWRAMQGWGERIKDWKLHIARSQAGRKGAQLRGRPQDEAPAQVNWANVQGHEDQLAGELLDNIRPLVKGIGFDIPDNIMGVNPRQALATVFKQHPDVIRQMVEGLNRTLARFAGGAGSPGGGAGSAIAAMPAGFDPTNPLTWPKEWVEGGGFGV